MEIKKIVNPGVLGIKTYVPGRSAEEVKKEYGLSKVIKLASNESATGVPEASIEALKAAASGLSVYPDPVSNNLRNKLSEVLGCGPDCITVSAGADGVIYDLAMALINEKDECLYPEITFPMYENVIKIMRGVPVVSKMKGYSIDLEDLLKRITPRTKLLFLTNPNNPTGDGLSGEEIKRFLKKVPSHVIVVLDEAYIEFAGPEADPGSVELFNEGMENLVILRTFSKIFGLAGIRIGYGIMHPELVKIIHTTRSPFPVSVAAQTMALAALNISGFRERVIEDVRNSREFYYARLKKLGLDYVPSHTNFVLIDTGYDCGKVFEGLLRKGIIVRPARGYGYPACIRVTFGTPEQNQAFFTAFEEVLEILKKEKEGGGL